jgi:hypothetical protein
MLVEMDAPLGRPPLRVKGTVPRNIERAMIELLYEHRAKVVNLSELVHVVPVRLTLTATLAPSEQDPTFGFFGHPSDAVLI